MLKDWNSKTRSFGFVLNACRSTLKEDLLPLKCVTERHVLSPHQNGCRHKLNIIIKYSYMGVCTYIVLKTLGKRTIAYGANNSEFYRKDQIQST